MLAAFSAGLWLDSSKNVIRVTCFCFFFIALPLVVSLGRCLSTLPSVQTAASRNAKC